MRKKNANLHIRFNPPSPIITGTNIFEEHKTNTLAPRESYLPRANILRNQGASVPKKSAATWRTRIRRFSTIFPRTARRTLTGESRRIVRFAYSRTASSPQVHFHPSGGDFTTSETLPISSIYSLFVLSCLLSLLPSRCPAFPLNGDLN